MEYLVFQTELRRRKTAYATLCTSLMMGTVLSSFVFDFPIPVLGYGLIALALALIGAFSFGFFYNLTRIKINLTDQSLKRVTNNSQEEYLLNEINRVVIKWTTNKTIREIYIHLKDKRQVDVTGLEDFDSFKNDLLGKLDPSVIVKEIHEPLDFDHPLFYSVLGLVISSVGTLVIKSMLDLSYGQITIVITGFSIYTILCGVYFLIAKPISKKTGAKTQVTDCVLGWTVILLGILSFLFYRVGN